MAGRLRAGHDTDVIFAVSTRGCEPVAGRNGLEWGMQSCACARYSTCQIEFSHARARTYVLAPAFPRSAAQFLSLSLSMHHPVPFCT